MHHIIVGTSIASLVAAHKLAEAKEKVTLIPNGGKWGAHFAGIDICNSHFDTGMTIIELGSNHTQTQSNLAEYDRNKRNDVGKYLGLVKEYLNELLPIREIDTPQSYFRGQWYNDFILSNNLDILDGFNQQEKQNIIDELSNRNSLNWRHSSNKLKQQKVYSTASYYEVSNYNHSELIHNQIIEPFIKKLTNLSTQKISALYHRRLWVPLYYPETLIQYLKGEIKQFTQTSIHYPTNSSLKGVVDALLRKINPHKNCTIIDEKIKTIDYTNKKVLLENNTHLNYESMAWGGSLAAAFKTFEVDSIKDYNTVRVSLTFAFAIISRKKLKKDFSVLFHLDKESPCYRITNLSNCCGETNDNIRVVLEYNTDYLQQNNSESEVKQTCEKTLTQLGIIDNKKDILDMSIKTVPKVLPMPTEQYNTITNHNLELLESHLKGLTLMGNSSGTSTRSFADNIVQGLQYSSAFL